MGVVTVSRTYGAGGKHIAAALAEALGYRVVDRDLVEAAATRAGLDPEAARQLDERAPAFVEKIGLALAGATPEFGLGAPVAMEDQTLADSIRSVMESLAQAGGYVILGRGGQAALHDFPGVCHLQVVGELEKRSARIAESEGISLQEAIKRCRKVDAERADYVRRFYGADTMDPLLYCAVLNTARLGLERASEVAAAVVRAHPAP